MPNPGKPKVNPKRMKEDVLNFDFERFTEEYSKLENLCKKLDEYDHALQETVKNYVTIRLVSILDMEIKMIIADLIDLFDVSPIQALGESSITVQLEDLEFVKSEEFTIGKVVTTNLKGYTTNVDTLSDIFSKINQVEFFPWLEKLADTKYQGKLKSLFNQRNALAHNLKNSEDSKDELLEKIKIVDGFANLSYMLSSLNLMVENEHRNDYLKTLELSVEKFTKVTAEFSKKSEKHTTEVHCGDCKELVPNPKFTPKPGTQYYCKKCLPNHR